MAFKAGSIYAGTKIDQTGWNSGLSSLKRGTGVAFAAIGAAISAAMVKAVKDANEFQKAMSNVSTIIDTSQISTQQLTMQLLKLDPALGDATELTNGLYQSFSSGATTAAEAMQTTTDAAKFAKAALTDTYTAVDVLTTAVNAYGKENMDTTKASDIFFTTIKDGKITGEQLASSIGASIPLFASTGIKLEELASGMAAMTKQGVDANNATTQLNAIVNSFLKPSEDMAVLLGKIGYESGSAFLKTEGLSGALKLLEESTQGDATELSKLLPNIRALRGAMALTGVGGEEFNKVMKDMEGATGATATAFDKQEKVFETFKNQMKNASIVVGNIGKAFVDHIAVGATKAAGGVITFLTSTRGMEIVSTIAAQAAGAFEVVKTVLQPLIDTIGPSLKQLFGTISETMDNVTGSTSEGAGATKILAVAGKGLAAAFAVVASVVGAAVTNIINMVNIIYRTGNLVTDFFDSILHPSKAKDLKKSAGEVIDSIKGFAEGVADGLGDIIGTVQEQFANFGEDTDALAQEIEIRYITAFTNTKEGIQANWAELLTGQKDFTGALVDENNAAMPALLGGFKSYTEGSDDGTGNSADTWVAYFNKLVDSGQKSYNQLNSELESALEKSLITQQTYLSMTRKLWEDNWTAITDRLQTIMDSVNTIISTGITIASNISQATLNKQLADITEEKDKELALIKEHYDEGLLTQEEYEAQKAAIEAKAVERENAAQKKAFDNQKTLELLSAGINASAAIMGWWAQAPKLGPIAGPIFAGTMTGATLAQLGSEIALIESKQFTPKRRGGPASGNIRMNEDGGELAILPNGSFVIPHDLSKELIGGPSYSIYVSLEGAIIKNDMDLEYVTNEVAGRIAKKLRINR